MADNIILNPGSAGSVVRTKDRAGVETSVVILDVGGASEVLLTAGQKAMAASLPVVIASDQPALTAAPARGTLTDRSGTITAGGTAQSLAPSNSTRSTLFIQNNSTGDLWINFTTTAVQSQPSIKVAAGTTFAMDQGFVSTEAVSIIGATTAQAYTAKEG